MISELPMSHQWQVTFRTSSSAEPQHAPKPSELPIEGERFAKTAPPASEPSKRAVA